MAEINASWKEKELTDEKIKWKIKFLIKSLNLKIIRRKEKGLKF